MTKALISQERKLYMALTKVEAQIKAVMPKSWDDEDFKRLLSCAALQSRKWGGSDQARQEILSNLDVGSFIEAVTTAASCNLYPDGRRGYLITRRGKNGYTVTFQADYKGLIDIAKRADPRILNIHADTIHTNDDFAHVEGSERRFAHSIPKETLATGRGECIAAYAIAYYEGGHYDVEIVPLADLKKIMSCASAGYGPNKDWPLQMHQKAAIRRLCKRLPETPDLARLIDNENSVYDQSPSTPKNAQRLEVSELPPVKVKEGIIEPEPEPGAYEPEEDGDMAQRKAAVGRINTLFAEAQKQGISVPMNVDGDTLYNMSLEELKAVISTLADVLKPASSEEKLPWE